MLRLYVARLIERAGEDPHQMAAIAEVDRATIYRWLRGRDGERGER